MENPLDFLSSMLDEVALEGLDGISLTTFWKRLEDRPNFSIAIDDDSKRFLWECIAVHKDIEFYVLPEPRVFVPPYNRFDYIDDELGIVIEPVEKLKDPYSPVVPVKDGEIMGSCATYKTRKCATPIVKKSEQLLMSLSQVVEKWGDCFVLVASQKARLLALVGTETNPLIEFNNETYCLLERIGRSRYLGEVTIGEDGLLALNTSFCKQLHYYRKKLSLQGLITKQLHYLKNKKGNTSNGCLLHLTRFYVERKTKMECFMKALIDLLKEKPQNRETCAIAREELGISKSTFKKLFYRPFQKSIQILNVSHLDFYPEATLKESHTLSGVPRTIKIVQLVKPLDEEKDEDNDESEKLSSLSLNAHFDYSKIFHGYPFLKQVYDVIVKCGPTGISASDLGRALTFPRLDIRNFLRVLIKKNYVISFLEDRGRQKVTKYFAKMYEKDNKLYNIIKEHEMSNPKILLNDKIDSFKRKEIEDLDENSQTLKKKVRFDDKMENFLIETNKDVANESSETGENTVDECIGERMELNDQNKLKADFQHIVSNVEIKNPEHFRGKSPKVVSISEKPIIPTHSTTSTPHLTFKKIQRSSRILEYLKRFKFTTIADLQKYLTEQEKQEEYKLCKRSTERLIQFLENSKKIKIFKVDLKLNDKITTIEFICDNSLEKTDPCFVAAIEQAKFKHFSVNKDKSNKFSSEQNKNESIEKENFQDKENLQSLPASDQTYMPKSVPKFAKARTLHEFLFYLVYQHKVPPVNPDVQQIYHDSFTWKRFVPPLPEYNDCKKEGWCFLSDIFSRIPLSVFLKTVHIGHPVPNLKSYLNDEEKQHYLLKYLPQDLCNSLLSSRKYLFSTYDVIKNLCFMGLISLGPQIGKQKDQVFLYVHKNASFKDTTISSPGYIHVQTNLNYETKLFTFKSLSDVENFWFDLENVCFNTPLGRYAFAAEKTFTVTEASFKSELKDCSENKKFDEISDSGHVPGDGLGAAGFDSALFMHFKRNWIPQSANRPSEVKAKDSKAVTKKFTMKNLLKTYASSKSENRPRLQRLSKPPVSLKRENIQPKEEKTKIKKEKIILKSKSRKQKTIIRTVRKRPEKKRVPYYDDIDKEAIKKMKKARCDWTLQEDTFLLLCKVSSLFLDSKYNKLVVPYTVVRDLLYQHLPDLSKNKSSRACQRRIRYMMLNPVNFNNVAVYLGEARQDAELVQEFNVEKPTKTHTDVWKNLFSRVVEKLVKKFTTPVHERGQKVILPNNLEDLNKNYRIIFSEGILSAEPPMHKEPRNITEIKSSVLNSLILSVMSLSNDGFRWKYILFQLYKSYPQHILLSVIANLRKNKILAIKKPSNKIDETRICSPTPYKFSITYENAFLTKFPVKMFQEAQILLDSFSTINSETGVELKGDVPPGYASAVLSLAAIQQLFIHTEIPEHIILFDASLSQEVRSSIVERIIHTLNEKESDELSRILNNELSSLNKSDVKIEPEHKPSETKCLPEGQTLDEDVFNPFSRPSNASRYALYLLRQEKTQPPIEKAQHSQDYIVLNSCRLFCKIKDSENITLPLNPPEIIEQIPEGVRKIKSDLIFKNETVLEDAQISKIIHLLTYYIPPSLMCVGEENLLNKLEDVYKNYDSQTLMDAKRIFHLIHQAGTKGVYQRKIWEDYQNLIGELSWNEHLNLLREEFFIIRVGILEFVFVSVFFAKPWLLKSCLWSQKFENNTCDVCKEENRSELSGEEIICNHEQSSYFDTCEKVYFLPRTWKKPDGTLNKSVFFNLLNTVLSHIISSPSITIKDLCKRFSLVMPPVQILELVEVLEISKCIFKYYCKPVKKTSLFSKPQSAFITEKPEPECIDHLENFPDAICKIAKLNQFLQ